jgi:hypothetical protein
VLIILSVISGVIMARSAKAAAAKSAPAAATTGAH